MSTPTSPIAAREWLAAADTDPAHAYRWWESNPAATAILPLGRTFEAVEVGAERAEEVLRHPGITGPVLRLVAGGHAYVLVPVGTSQAWTVSAALCLDEAHYLAVPDPSRVAPPGAYWVRPPDGSGTLTDPAVLAEVVTRAGAGGAR